MVKRGQKWLCLLVEDLFFYVFKLFVYERDGVGGHAEIASVAGVGVGGSSSGPRPAVLS